MRSRKTIAEVKRRQTGRIVLIRDNQVLPRAVRLAAAAPRPPRVAGCGA
jgi:hypothetical protein